MRPSFEAMKKYFSDKKVVGIEVGTSAGINAIGVLFEWKNLERLDCVDCYLVYPEYIDFTDGVDQTLLRNICIANFVEEPRAHLTISTSIEGAKKFKDASVDFVYIDANHAYKYVKEDIVAWLPKIKKGGVIAGHDWDWKDKQKDNELAVKKAVEEVFDRDKVHYYIDVYEVNKKEKQAKIDSDWWVFL